MSSAKRVHADILRHRRQFEILVDRLARAPDLAAREGLARAAITLAVHRGTGYCASREIEQVFLEIADEIADAADTKPVQTGSVLHVMSECYATGGHTRVVERWIEQAAAGQSHSLAVTRAVPQKVPPRLRAAVADSGGTVTRLLGDDRAKARDLRRLAASQAVVVLHAHMDDVVPLMAFGTERFERPVILYNHADHRFWVGVAIADMIAETRTFGQHVTRNRRGAEASQVLGIPCDTRLTPYADRAGLRRHLGLPAERKIILSAGSAVKYRAVGRYDFAKLVDRILADDAKTCFVLVGYQDHILSSWRRLKHTYGDRLLLLPPMAPDALYRYVQAADVALDSFPQSGGTALLDITCCGCPVLALACPTGHLDYLYPTSAYCHDEAQLLGKLRQLLADPTAAAANVAETGASLTASLGPDAWRRNLDAIVHAAGPRHHLHDFQPALDLELSELDILNWSLNRDAMGPRIVRLWRRIGRGLSARLRPTP